jgi:phosphatidylinositol alpha-1,6-mannosyltransferase
MTSLLNRRVDWRKLFVMRSPPLATTLGRTQGQSDCAGRSAGETHLVLSEIFPPTKGGSGKWLAEIYARLRGSSNLMVVGGGNRQRPEFEADIHYPHPIIREDLEMPFRGIAQLSSLLDYYRIASRVYRLAKAHRVTALHAARPLFEGLVARLIKLRTGLPYLCFVHGEDINIAMTSRELRFLTAAVLSGATKVIANSSFTKELLLSDWKMKARQVELMHPGVDCRYFTPTKPMGEKALLPENCRILLTVGRLQERKGHDCLIAGLPAIRRLFPDVLYVIAGDGEQRPVLQAQVMRLGLEQHVFFLGEIDDVKLRQCYRECELFVLPNRAVGRDIEGFGMVLLEAQACGRPVVAGRSGGTSDALKAEETGLLVNCQDPERPEELVAAVCRLLGNDNERLAFGNAARSFVESHFDWAILAAQAERVLTCSKAVAL